MRKAYKFRIYPSKETTYKINHWLDLCRNLYNSALEHRILAYRTAKKSIFYKDQQDELPQIKKLLPEYKEVFSQTLQAPLKILDNAFKSFFRRVKSGDKEVGFPRFKGKNRFDSICFPQYPFGIKLIGNKLRIGKIGIIKVKLHREVIGNIKTATIKRTPTGKWFVIFSCEDVPVKLLPATNQSCGIDMGIKSFIAISDGTKIHNPKFFDKSKTILERRQQKLSELKKGSKKRNKQRLLVAKIHERIANQRQDFHFKLANKLCQNYDTICAEDLNIKGMNKWRTMNRNIRDASWGNFLNILSAKVEETGRTMIRVNPKNTSQICSGCGVMVHKTLSDRIHNCPSCNLILDRDINSARNILRLGTSLLDTHSHTVSREAPPLMAG